MQSHENNTYRQTEINTYTEHGRIPGEEEDFTSRGKGDLRQGLAHSPPTELKAYLANG